MRWIWAALVALIGWGLAAAGDATPTAGAGTLVLDQGAYWRCYVQFGPDRLDAGVLKREGAKLLSAGRMKRLRKQVEQYWQPPFAPAGEAKDLAALDWRDHARVWFPVGQGDSQRAALNNRRPAPPADWMQPEFDTAAWPRQRMPMGVGNMLRPSTMHGDKEMQQLGMEAAFFRTTFRVADPAAGGYQLSLRFRGGARVFLNGTEIARGHLPEGKLTADTLAEGYPSDAYVCLRDEVPAKSWEREHRKVGVMFCEDLPGEFDDAFADDTKPGDRQYWSSRGRSQFAGYFGGWTPINRKGFGRITRLRNRSIEPVLIPSGLLRAGRNVLAVEVRSSPIHPITVTGVGGNWGRAFQRVMYWSHCRLLEVELRSARAAAPSAMRRPAGVGVWGEDIHRRCWTADFGPEADGPGTLRFVGAANGTYCAQLVVGTDRPLSGLTATAGALTQDGGSATIPADAIRVAFMVGHPATELVRLGQIRNTVGDRSDPLCPPAEQAILRFGPPAARARRLPRPRRLAIAETLTFFDHIGGSPAGQVAADTCRPLWVWLTIPPDAEAGTYRGSLRVQAEGMAPVDVPITAEVVAWRLPSPRAFQTIVALEQSPYGVARQYKVPLWSQEHFRLLEASFRELGRVGNDLLFIPCLQHTEFGNFEDTMIRWIRRRDGTLAFDYAALDRYLALARKHLGAPRVICFVVMHGADRFGPGAQLASTVNVFDEATGKTAPLGLSSGSPAFRESWKAFATALRTHLGELGLAESMHWGFCWDNEGDPLLPQLLAGLMPEVPWCRSGHRGRLSGRFHFVCTSLSRQITEQSMRGWKAALPDLLCPRSGSSVLSSNGHSPPFTFRLMADRALVSGGNGVGRLGADYFADLFFRGYKGSLSGGIAGMPCSTLLWPGPHGAQSSARFEALREGIQEAEARIYLEQAADRGLIGGPLAERVRRVLFEHNRETLYISPGRIGVQVHEYAAGWQARSRRLYAAAAAVAAVVGLDVDRAKIAGRFAARSRAKAAVVLRNWTTRPRQWSATADRPWIHLEKDRGAAAGHEPLEVAVDTGVLAPGSTATGRLVVTDVASGRRFPIEVTATVGKVGDLLMPAFDFLGAPGHAASRDPKRIADGAVFNVAPGGQDGGEYAVVNHSGTPLAWRIESSARWLTARPASGELAPGARTFVKVTARPPGTIAATHHATLSIMDRDGSARRTKRITAHVIPNYTAPPLPAGTPVDLKDLPKTRVLLHKSTTYWLGTSARDRADFGPRFGPNHQVDKDGQTAAATTMHGSAEQITVYDAQDAGWTAFSARVLISRTYRKPTMQGHHRARVSFEVHADGKLVAQSGLMTAADAARRIVAAIPAGTKQVRLVTRFDRPEAANLLRRVYVRWEQPRFYRTP